MFLWRNLEAWKLAALLEWVAGRAAVARQAPEPRGGHTPSPSTTTDPSRAPAR